MNDALATFGLLDWKPLLTAFVLPPVPLLVMLVMAWWWQRRRPLLATVLLMSAVAGLWASQCLGFGVLLERQLAVAPALSATRLAELRRGLPANRTAVVVLGNGTRALAAEYGEAHLDTGSMERLHYGLWLSRQLQLPVMVSGGAGLAQPDGPAEATVAGRVASRDYGRTIRWLETESADTRANARRSLQLLKAHDISDVVLVTHTWHMRRALRAFETEAQLAGQVVRLVPASMGITSDQHMSPILRWMPSAEGNQRVRQTLREWLGLLAGA